MLLTESLVKMGKWSEGDQWEVDRDGAREESEDVITRSRICQWQSLPVTLCQHEITQKVVGHPCSMRPDEQTAMAKNTLNRC